MLNLLSLFKHHPNNIIDPKQYNIIPSYFLLFFSTELFQKEFIYSIFQLYKFVQNNGKNNKQIYNTTE